MTHNFLLKMTHNFNNSYWLNFIILKYMNTKEGYISQVTSQNDSSENVKHFNSNVIRG